jgi:hypothetical protein
MFMVCAVANDAVAKSKTAKLRFIRLIITYSMRAAFTPSKTFVIYGRKRSGPPWSAADAHVGLLLK